MFPDGVVGARREQVCLFDRRVKNSTFGEPADEVASRVMTGGPITRAAAAASVQAVAVADCIATEAETLAWIRGDLEPDLYLFDKFARVHSQAQNFRRGR